jgi:hypothetical protein
LLFLATGKPQIFLSQPFSRPIRPLSASDTSNQNQHGSNVLEARDPRANYQDKSMYPDKQISSNPEELNGLAKAARDAAQILAERYRPTGGLNPSATLLPAPIRHKNSRGDPPGEPELAGTATQPTPQIHQIGNSTQQLAGSLPNGKPPLEVTNVAEELVPTKTVPCRTQLRYALSTEGESAAPAFCYFDSDLEQRFCRLAVISANTANPAMRKYMEKGDVDGVRFLAAAAFAKFLLRHRNPLARTLLGEVKTLVGVAPNTVLSIAAFARTLARSSLLEPISRLPVFGQSFAGMVGRSFPLAEIDLAIPVAELGPPWNGSPSERKESP